MYVFFFAAAFAFVEAAVVVYLRDLYYPGGFHFPIKYLIDRNLIVELFRELATVVMMVSVAVIASSKSNNRLSSMSDNPLTPFSKGERKNRFWEGFGYFLIIFGVWDIFFYIWLKAAIGWPESLFTWDILFLLPVPWIGPVLAPVIVSALMIFIGFNITRWFAFGYNVKPKLIHWALVLAGTAFVFYTFMSDSDAGFHENYPKPYNWILFVIGIGFYIVAFLSLRASIVGRSNLINKNI